MKNILGKIYLFSKVVFSWLKDFTLKTKKFFLAALIYIILILIFSFLYKAVYVASVLEAEEVLEKRAKQTAWNCCIRLYQLTELEQNNTNNDDLISGSQVCL